MPPTLFLAPSTEAALRHAVEAARGAQQANPLAPIVFLLPDANAVRQARRRLGSGVGTRLESFYTLGEAVLRGAGSPTREVGGATLRRLVRYILDGMAEAGTLGTFAPIFDKPGFGEALVGWLREMKTQGIAPDAARREAAASGREQGRELAAFYARYQHFLQGQAVSEADGLLWLAAEALEADASLFRHPQQFLVLGFDQFTPIQRRILRALAARLPHFALYLLWDPARPAASLALTRLRATRAALEASLPGLVAEALPAPVGDDPHLAHLRRHLFETVAAPPVSSHPPSVAAIAAPSREAEARAALRLAKQRLLEGCAPHRIALLAPQPAAYARLVATVADEYGVPLALDEPLLDNPALAALLNTLALAPDFPWRETWEALRSPYLDQRWLDADQLSLLDHLSRLRPVVAGRSQWQSALRPLAWMEDDESGALPSALNVTAETLAAVEQGLLAFFDALTPPDEATVHGFALWVQEAILGLFADEAAEAETGRPSLRLAARAAEGPFAARDERALRVVGRALRSLVEAETLVPTGGDGRVPWGRFRAELAGALAALSLRPEGMDGRVRFGALEEGRAVAVDHLFVLGLSEGEFPRPPEPDLFYTAAERQASTLPLRQVDPAEDASLWWQVLGNCRRSLTLLRPRLDDKGVPWLPSPYWEATLAQLPTVRVEEPPIAALPDAAASASHAELLAALASRRAAGVPAPLRPLWAGARVAQRIMAQRANRAEPPGPHEGILVAPDLRAEVAHRFGSDHPWSVSRLNRYGQCPYGFFAEHVLELEARPDPEEGLDARARGSLLHAILEQLHRRLGEAGLALAPDSRDAALALLEETCNRVLPRAPQQYGFRPGELWRHEQAELRRLLRALVAWECDTADATPFHPFQQELRFGGEAPLELRHEGTAFQLRGVIDRLDRDGAGRLRLVDYKSAATPYSQRKVERGLALQTALYALAAARLLPDTTMAESFYLHLPSHERGGEFTFAGRVDDDDGIQAALALAARFVERVRAGWFPSAPGDPEGANGLCAASCPFAPLCRPTRDSARKAASVTSDE